MDADLHFGTWLKQRRKALDLTQEDLARRVGYSVSAIRKVEANKLRPSRHVVENMAQALAIRPEERPALVRFARDEPGVDELDLPHQTVTLPQPVMQRHLNNFPIPLTSFIGREREMAVVKELLSKHRLLTLTGAGGVGKTRLAIQLATDLVDVFRDGVVWVELAALSDPALVPQAIANILCLREFPNQSLIETLSNYLLSHRLLLMLDNCEHLINACAQLAETLLHTCPDLHILVDKSLVVVIQHSEGTRYGLLETIRQYADEKLRMADEAPWTRQRHAQIFLAFAEEAAPKLNTAQRNTWMRRLQAEHENLRAAIGWSIEQGAAEVGFRLIGALEDFWVARGYLTEARTRLAELLALPGCGLRASDGKVAGNMGSSPSGRSESEIPRSLAAIRARAFNAGAALAMFQEDLHEALILSEESVALWRALDSISGLAWGLSRLGEVKECLGDDTAARALWEESLDLAQSIDEKPVMGWTLLRLGRFTFRRGDVAAARSLLEQSLAIWRALDNATGVWSTFRELGYLALFEGDYLSAQVLFEESLNLARRFESTIGVSHALLPLGHLALQKGQYGAASSFYEETLAIGRVSNQKGLIATSLYGLGMLAFRQGKLALAHSLVRESLSILRVVRKKHEIIQYLECLAQVAFTKGRPERAAKKISTFSATLPETLRFPALLHDLGDRDFVASVRAAIGEEAFTLALEEARAMMMLNQGQLPSVRRS